MEPAQRPRGDPRRRQHGETDLQSADRPATLEFELEVCDPAAPLCSTDTVKVTVKAPEAVVDASVEAIINGKVSGKKTSKSISAQIRNLGTGTLTVCASDVSWTVTVNGSPTGSVSPKEGCKTLSPGAKTKFTYTWNYGAGTVKAGDTVKFTATVTVSGDSISGNNSDSVTVKASK